MQDRGEGATAYRRVLDAIALRKSADRVPVMLLHREFTIRHCGLKFSECLAASDRYVQAQLRCLREFGFGNVMDLHAAVPIISESLGARLVVPEDEPVYAEPIIESQVDLRKLQPIVLKDHPRMRDVIFIIRRLKEEMRDEVPVLAWVSTPFRTACMLRGIQSLMLDLLEEPDFARELIGRAVDYCAQYAENVVEAGADIILTSNPTASAGLISRAHYQEFVTGYSKQLFDRIRALRKPIVYHVCGDWRDRLDLVVAEGPQILHVDQVELADIKPTIGSKVCLMGNVKTINTLLNGTPADVRAEAAKCVAAAGEGGFILSADCILAPATPAANVRALIDAGQGGTP